VDHPSKLCSFAISRNDLRRAEQPQRGRRLRQQATRDDDVRECVWVPAGICPVTFDHVIMSSLTSYRDVIGFATSAVAVDVNPVKRLFTRYALLLTEVKSCIIFHYKTALHAHMPIMLHPGAWLYFNFEAHLFYNFII